MCQSSVGTFAPSGYHHPTHDYIVNYHDASSRSLMSDDWQLDNFFGEGSSLKAKTGADYESELFLDTNDDGTTERLGTVPTFDLRFTHKRHTGVIWLRTRPLEKKDTERELRVLMDSLVDRIAGTGYRVVELGGILYETNKQRTYATKLTSSGTTSLAGKEAYTATVEVANVDQLKLDPNHVEARLMLVIARTPYIYTTAKSHGKRQFPIVMLAGCVSAPADFADSRTSFVGLLNRVRIGNEQGFVDQSPRARDAAPPPAEPKPQTDASPSEPVAADAAPASG